MKSFHLSTDCTLNIGAVDGRGLVERLKAGTIEIVSESQQPVLIAFVICIIMGLLGY